MALAFRKPPQPESEMDVLIRARTGLMDEVRALEEPFRRSEPSFSRG